MSVTESYFLSLINLNGLFLILHFLTIYLGIRSLIYLVLMLTLLFTLTFLYCIASIIISMNNHKICCPLFEIILLYLLYSTVVRT